MKKIVNRGSKSKTIDVHAHLIPVKETAVEEKYKSVMPVITRDSFNRDVLMIKGQPPFTISEQLFNTELRIQEMDKTSVDIQVLSIMPPLIQYDMDPDLCVGYSQIQNNALNEIIQVYPNRFLGLATVPLIVPKEAAVELERTMKEHGMKGVQILSDVNGRNLDWPELWPFYEKAQELGAFILCHPNIPSNAERMDKYHLRNLVGNPFYTSLAIASLIFGGVLKDFPKLKFCFAHAGGFAPYQRGRLDHGYKVRVECREFIPKPPSEYFKLLYFDTITHYGPALDYLVKSAGVEKVLLGSDYPFDMADEDPVTTTRSLESISAAEKEKILGGNATELLGMSV